MQDLRVQATTLRRFRQQKVHAAGPLKTGPCGFEVEFVNKNLKLRHNRSKVKFMCPMSLGTL